jgi:hypothetical protein
VTRTYQNFVMHAKAGARWYTPSLLFAIGACTGVAPDSSVDITTETQAIKNGALFTAPESPFVQLDTGCSGTLLRNDWVLTAGHCLPNTAEGRPESLVVRDVNRVDNFAQALAVYRTHQLDMGLVKLARPLRVNGATAGLRTEFDRGDAEDTSGLSVICHGIGANSCDATGAWTMREGRSTVVSTEPDFLQVQGTQTPLWGDSGGSCTLARGSRVGIAGIVNTASCEQADLLSASVLRPMAHAVMASDGFGASLATADLDGDGRTELIVGAPGQRAGGSAAGVVWMFEDDGAGGFRWLYNLAQDPLDSNEDGDRFGAALAVADFDQDGVQDLMVGAPGETTSAGIRAGAVYAFRGSPAGPVAWARIDQPPLDANHSGDQFGATLATGQFDPRDPAPDLVVGAPLESNGSARENDRLGAIYLFSGRGLRGSAPVAPFQRVLNESVPGTSTNMDRFGGALAIGDFDGDRRDDIAIGAIGEGSVVGTRSGLVVVFEPASNTRYRLDQAGLGTEEVGDLFGYSLAAADLDGDSRSDLLVGAPGEAFEDGPRAGRVFVYRGMPDQLRPWQLLDQTGIGMDEAGDFFGARIQAGDLDRDGRQEVFVAATFERAFGMTAPDSGFVFGYEFDPAVGKLVARAGLTSPGGGTEDSFGAAMTIASVRSGAAVRSVLGVAAPGRGLGRVEVASASLTLSGPPILP